MISRLLSSSRQLSASILPTSLSTRTNLRSSLIRSFCENGQQHRIFYPQSPLNFTKGRLLVAEVKFKGYYLWACAISGILAFFLYKSARKLYTYSERSFLRNLFWFIVLSGVSLTLRSMHNQMSTLITKVWLKDCGQRVALRTGMGYMRDFECSIRDIQRPEVFPQDIADPSTLLVGFPVFVGGSPMLVSRDIERFHPDLFGAIFNGMEVQVGQGEDDESYIDI